MKANELKIGNWLDSEQGLVQASELHLFNNKIGVKSPNFENFVWSNCDSLQPIILTEEWHNKFGVQKNGFMSFEYVLPIKNNLDIKVIFSGDYVFLRQSLSDDITEDGIVSVWNKDLTKRGMYVHEWQNLYFALTGEELIHGGNK